MPENQPTADPQFSLTFIGNATTLLRIGGFTVLTDPNFLHRGEFAHLGYGLRSRRLTEPAMRIEDLPVLDAVLLSHLHDDHWDHVAQAGLSKQLPVITTEKSARALRKRGFDQARGTPTWTTHRLSSKTGETLIITAMPGQHAPGLAKRLLPPVMGSMLEYRQAGGSNPELALYISGDTLLIPQLREIPRRYQHLDAAVLHLGGTTLPGGLMVSMNAAQGADLVELLNAPVNIAVHHSDYGVFKSPLGDFTAEMTRRQLADRVRYVEPGETLSLIPDRRH